jgi:hypothetical protein
LESIAPPLFSHPRGWGQVAHEGISLQLPDRNHWLPRGSCKDLCVCKGLCLVGGTP